MSRPFKVLLVLGAMTAVAALLAACGTERINVSKSNPSVHWGAVLFSQRCAGCHTLAYAGTHGSAANVRTREITNGPNFDVRCERPVTRVLYAIQNGGFSGAIMPQNIVVGKDAQDVAQFVATYAGRQAPKAPGVPTCDSHPVGTLPAPATTTAASAPAQTTTTTSTTSSSTSGSKSGGKSKKK